MKVMNHTLAAPQHQRLRIAALHENVILGFQPLVRLFNLLLFFIEVYLLGGLDDIAVPQAEV
jgi:hypothetical protein